jgi:ADP-ribose pyrophosphatase
MSGYEVRSTTVTHEGILSNVRVDDVAMPDGGTAQREVVQHADAVAVVAIDPDGHLVLLRHYRHAVRERQLELPAGMLDVDGEAPIDAAHRELREEVGLRAAHLEPLLHFYNSAGWSEEATTIYFADDVEAGVPDDDFEAVHEESDLEVVRLPPREALALVESGEIRDAKTVIGILLAARRMGI